MTLKIMNCGNGPFWVADLGARLFAMSQLYDTESDAMLVREWLEERAAGYPPNRVLVNEPRF